MYDYFITMIDGAPRDGVHKCWSLIVYEDHDVGLSAPAIKILYKHTYTSKHGAERAAKRRLRILREGE